MDALDFENIVDRYYARLYRFALGLARNEPDACDLTQQTFATWAAKGHLLRDKTKVKTWLFTTLYRQFLLHCRHETRWPKEEISQSEHALPTPTPETIDLVEPELLMECLQSMNDNFRVPLVLFYLQDHSYKEIADMLAVPIGTVMSRLSRAKQRLQRDILCRQEQMQPQPLAGAGDRSR